jgi:hypothetical protein
MSVVDFEIHRGEVRMNSYVLKEGRERERERDDDA